MHLHKQNRRIFAGMVALILAIVLTGFELLVPKMNLAVADPTAPARVEVDCTDCEEAGLRAAITQAGTTPTRIVVSGSTNTMLTSTLVIPQGADIELVNGMFINPGMSEGGLRREDDFTGTMVHVQKGASLTLGNNKAGGRFYIDSRGQWVPGGGELIFNEGTLTINSGTYYGVRNGSGQKEGAITVSGPDATFTLNGGKVTDNQREKGNSSVVQGGAANIAVTGGAKFIMNGGEVSKGETGYEHGAYGEVGGIGVYSGGSATINGGEIYGNSGWTGGLLGYDFDIDKQSATDPQKTLAERNYITINGGKIHNNRAYFSGGGAFAFGNTVIEMNGGVVDSNFTNGNGGGIGTLDLYVWGADRTYREIPGLGKEWGLSKEEWGKVSPGSFIFNGGVISNNEAQRTGGGVNVVSNQVEINAGQILNNKAHDQGGGIYVATVSYNLHLHDVVVTKNTATAEQIDGVGGGIWSCPTGSIELRMHNGGAVFDNTAKDFGNDLAHMNLGSTGAAPIWVSDYMLGGGRIDYYFDNEGKRFDPASLTKPEKERPLPVPLKYMSIQNEGFQSVVHKEEAKENALKQAKLLIQGNSAPRGGGIGTNGGVIFGDWGYAQATVEKAWVYGSESKAAAAGETAGGAAAAASSAHPVRESDITVKKLDMRLMRDTDKDFTHPEKVADFTLSPSKDPEKNWRKTFDELAIKADNGDFYYYFVQELDSKGKVVKTLPLQTWQDAQKDGKKLPKRPPIAEGKMPPETWLVGTVVNKIPNPVDITVNKQWIWKDSAAPVPGDKTPNQVEFELVRATDADFTKAEVVQKFTVTKADNWVKQITGLPYQDKDMHRYYYGVREIGGDAGIIAVPFAQYEKESGPIQVAKDGIIHREVTVVNKVPNTPPPPTTVPKTGASLLWGALAALSLCGIGGVLRRVEKR